MSKQDERKESAPCLPAVARHHGDMPAAHALAHVAAAVTGAPRAPTGDLAVHDGVARLDVLHGAQAGQASAGGRAVDLADAVAEPLVVAVGPFRPEAPLAVLRGWGRSRFLHVGSTVRSM